MEIVMTTATNKTTLKIEDKDIDKLVKAIYWFLKDNYINSTIIKEEIKNAD